MKKIFVIFILLFTMAAYAQEEVSVALEHVAVDLKDKKSLKRGAKFFATNCMVCHSMIYMRYDPIAKASGVLYEKMPLKITKWPFDIKPPDLSLEVSHRGADWVYTYLHSFYVDTARPTGANNLLVPNTAMPGIIMVFEGQQTLVPKKELDKTLYHQYQWYDLVQQQKPGTMTQEQFDATITDLVNFLTYASDPYQVEQENLGKWVIGFLFILFILMYFLKQSYWKDIKRKKAE